MLLRLAYLGITNAFALLRLLPGGDRDKDIEILSLRHQLAVLQRQLDGRVRFEPVDRAWLAALLHRRGPTGSGPPTTAARSHRPGRRLDQTRRPEGASTRPRRPHS
jgi:hypothetical protein